MKYYGNKFKDDYVVGLLSKGIDLKVLRKFQTKFPKLADLLQGEQQFRREKVTVHPAPGSGPEESVVDESPKAGKKLPDIRDFAIKVRPYDGLFLLFGLLKRFPPKLTFGKGRNAEKNKYVNYMFTRLRTQVSLGEYDAAVDTMGILMNSTAYLDMGYNYVVRNGHRKRPLGLVERELKEIKKLIKSKASSIDYSRVYLDEIKKLRPLGVPTVPWRVYLHMYNNLLTEWRLVSEKGIQHGYLPGLGVLTAWEKLVKLLDRSNLFEADFQGFFDNVTHRGIADVLKSIGFPPSEIEFINDLNSSVVSLPQKLMIPETSVDVHTNLLRMRESERAPDPKEKGLPSYWNSKGRGLITIHSRIKEQNPLTDPSRDARVQEALDKILGPLLEGQSLFSIVDEEKNLKIIPKTIGVPQGAPTSCSVATLCLREIETRMKSVLYADDGVYSPETADDSEICKVEDPEKGVKLNPDKGKWLKKNGKGVVDEFKFLGITYYPPSIVTARVPRVGAGRPGLQDVLFKIGGPRLLRIEGRFEAQTRNGATLKFTNRESLLSYLSVARDNMLQTDGSPGKQYFMDRPLKEWIAGNTGEWSNLRNKCMLLGNNRQTGGLVARMYVNSGSLKIKQDFSLSYRKDSGMGLRWPVYANYHRLSGDSITIFTASSFASDDLAYLIENPVKAKKRLKLKFKRVYHGRKPTRNDSLLSGFRLGRFNKSEV